MIPICMPLSLTLCVNARDYTTDHPSSFTLLSVELVLANIACHPCGYQIIQGQPVVATLADLSSRDVMQAWRKCTAVDTLPIGGKKWIVWEMKWPFAITNNQLKGSKHLA